VTPLFAVFEATIWVKSTHQIKSCLKTRKRENMEINEILHKAPSKGLLWNGIYSFLRRADARGSADFIYCIWCISL